LWQAESATQIQAAMRGHMRRTKCCQEDLSAAVLQDKIRASQVRWDSVEEIRELRKDEALERSGSGRRIRAGFTGCKARRVVGRRNLNLHRASKEDSKNIVDAVQMWTQHMDDILESPKNSMSPKSPTARTRLSCDEQRQIPMRKRAATVIAATMKAKSSRMRTKKRRSLAEKTAAHQLRALSAGWGARAVVDDLA